MCTTNLIMKKLWLLGVLLTFVLSASSQSKVDSLLQKCRNADEKQKTAIYLELSFSTRNDTAQSNSYSRLAYALAVKHHQIPEQAQSVYYLGETCYFARDFAGAIPYYEKAIPIYTQLKDTFSIINCHSSLGLSLHNTDQGEKAIVHYIQGLKLCEKNREYAAEILNNIGNVHRKMQNHRDAIKYYHQAKAINSSIKDSVSLAVNYNGLGESFLVLEQPDSSLASFSMAHMLFKKMHNIPYQAIALANLGAVYANYPDSLEKAYEAYSQSWLKFQELGLAHYEDAIKSGFGDVFIKQGRYKEAAKAYLESLQLSQHFNKGFEAKKIIYGKLSKTYELMGDYKSALKYHTFFAQYSDSLNKKEKYEQLINVEKKYETEKKENEIIQLQAKQELTDVQLRKNKQLKQLAFITASLLLIFAFFVLMKYLDKLKSNQLLKLKNQQIEESEQELRRLNAAKNKFFSIIAHDLKNPLHNVMGYSYLLSKDYDNFSEKERKKFAADINQSTNNIFRLLQNLLEWAKTQTGALNFSPMEIEFKRILENSFSVLRPLAQQKSIEVKFSLTDDLKLYADPQMIETVLRNLINNAIKFTPENGSIEISAQSAGDYVRVNITDSGIGIAGEDVENLFRIDSKVKRKGTNNEDGSGLGLIICKEFIDKNNGTISVTSTPGEGSSFSFTLPAKAIA